MERKELGKYIAADPRICDGKPAFRGTRITVRRVLEMVAAGKDWATIGEELDGKVNQKAIAEALFVATQALVKYEHRRPAWLDDEDCDWLNDKSLVWPEAKTLGQYVVANPKICHGQVTFRGTRMFVQDALEMVAEGRDWNKIIWEFHNRISEEAIAEAVLLAAAALENYESSAKPATAVEAALVHQ